MPDGSEHPVVYASHTLQVDTTTLKWSRKLFSLIFGLCKIHPYLNGRRFTIVMDHKPLITILGWKQGIPTLALGHGNMDGLSRLLLPETSNEATMLNVIAYLLLLWTGGCHLKWFVDELSSEVHETMVATASSRGAISTLAQWANGKRRNNIWGNSGCGTSHSACTGNGWASPGTPKNCLNEGIGSQLCTMA